MTDYRNILHRASKRAILIGGGGTLLMLVGLIFSREQFFRAYLSAYLLTLGIALGSLMLVMLHHLVGGAWGLLIRRIAETAAMTLPALSILFIPIVLGFHWLYPWARPGEVAADPILQHRRHQFNTGAILIRAIIYFAIWSFWAWRLRANSLQQDRSPDPRISARARTLSASGLVIFFITISFAAVDWIASREPHWYSSVFGLLVIVGQAAAAISFALVVLSILARISPLGEIALPDALHDLGNLLLTIVILWAYISFAQFLVIWIGNSNEDNIFFYHRSRGIWQLFGITLIVLHFSVPFLLLLNQGAKRNIRILGAIAAGVLLLRFVDNLWLVAPSSSTPESGTLSWLDLVAPVALGGIWLALFLRQLAKAKLIPAASEALPAALKGASA